MAVTAEQVRAFVNVDSDADNEVQSCLVAAKALLDEYVEDVPTDENDQTTLPDAIYDRAWLLVAAELFHQDRAPNGVLNQQFEDGPPVPIRVSADPLRPAYPLLASWVPPVIA